MSIFPYIYFMVKSFDIATKETEIAFYAGTVTAAFTLGELASGMFWGRVSDRIGRKYVLLVGMLGTGFSMLVFGFSKSWSMALVARALGGLLNG
jgi:MFS family permease